MSTKKLVVPCKFYQEGRCSEGSRCRFLHLKKNQTKSGTAANNTTSDAPNVAATCKYFAMGTCKFGDRCALRHVGPDTPHTSSTSSSVATRKTTSTAVHEQNATVTSKKPQRSMVILTPDGRRITQNAQNQIKKVEEKKPPCNKPTDSTAVRAVETNVWNHNSHTSATSEQQANTVHGDDGKENRNSAMSSIFDQMSLFSSPPSVVSSLFTAPPSTSMSVPFGSELSVHVNSYIPLSHDAFPGFDLSPAEPLTRSYAATSKNNPVSYSNVASQGVVIKEPQSSAVPIKAPPFRIGLPVGTERRRSVNQNSECPAPSEQDSTNGIECSICFENPLEKRSRFGLLDCAHCFCLSCIRDWRSAGYGTQVKSCPQCRTVTHFVVPSAVWITDEAEKAKLREVYKNNMSTIACRHYNFGDGSCPFGTSCHYAHMNRDGTRQEVTLRKFVGENEEVQIMTEVRLSDFFR